MDEVHIWLFRLSNANANLRKHGRNDFPICYEALMDLLSEERIALRALAAEEGIDLTTAWRWVSKGVRGVKLESFMAGGRRMTTREAFARFARACTEASAAGASRPTCSTRQPQA